MSQRHLPAQCHTLLQDSGILWELLGQQPLSACLRSAHSQHSDEVVLRGKSLVVEQTHGMLPQAGHTAFDTSSAAQLPICLTSKKKQTLGIYLDDKCYI